MAARDERTAFVVEDSDDEDRHAATFSTHWEAGRKDAFGPEGVSAEEAIAWGREHAATVYVRLGDEEEFSAGEVPLDDLPQWPKEGIALAPRPLGSPWDGSVQEVPWRVRVFAGESPGLRERFEAEPDVVDVFLTPVDIELVWQLAAPNEKAAVEMAIERVGKLVRGYSRSGFSFRTSGIDAAPGSRWAVRVTLAPDEVSTGQFDAIRRALKARPEVITRSVTAPVVLNVDYVVLASGPQTAILDVDSRAEALADRVAPGTSITATVLGREND